jgi:DNA replication protein DnaD
MKERGKYQLQLLKTRNSSGVGSKVDLDFDVVSLKISDTDDQEENESAPVTSTPTSNRINILDAVKNRTNAQQQETNVEERSGKLREFLQNLGDSEFVPT